MKIASHYKEYNIEKSISEIEQCFSTIYINSKSNYLPLIYQCSTHQIRTQAL